MRGRGRRGRCASWPVLRRPDPRAVSGVVAASLGVVLISVLLGMVVTFWVPAWGYDSEVSHSREMVNAFAQFKNALELQTLSGNVNQTLTATFPLGVGAVPLFGAETAGQLSYQYLESGRVRFRANLTDTTGQVNFSAAGSLEYTMPNRYFVRQEFAYETGAVIVAQSDGQAMRLTPPFRFVNGTQGLEVFVTLFSLDGPQAVVTGVESHTVSSKLNVAQTFTYSWAPNSTVSLNVSTSFVDAWARYFADAMGSSAVNASLYNITRFPAVSPESVTLRLDGVRALTVTVSLVQIKID